MPRHKRQNGMSNTPRGSAKQPKRLTQETRRPHDTAKSGTFDSAKSHSGDRKRHFRQPKEPLLKTAETVTHDKGIKKTTGTTTNTPRRIPHKSNFPQKWLFTRNTTEVFSDEYSTTYSAVSVSTLSSTPTAYTRKARQPSTRYRSRR